MEPGVTRLAYNAGQRADRTRHGLKDRTTDPSLAYDAGQRADWTLIAVFRARLAYTRLGARLASKRFSQALKSWSNHIAHLGHHTMMPAAKSTPNTACPQGL